MSRFWQWLARLIAGSEVVRVHRPPRGWLWWHNRADGDPNRRGDVWRIETENDSPRAGE